MLNPKTFAFPLRNLAYTALQIRALSNLPNAYFRSNVVLGSTYNSLSVPRPSSNLVLPSAPSKDTPSSSSFSFYARCFSSNATVNRLAQAKARREKVAAARAKADSHEEPQTIEAPTTTAVTVTPIEATPSELQVANVVDHPALIITRPIEWGSVILGYEQANRYTVYNQDGQIVAQIAEQIEGLANSIGRQLLRTRRSFTATVFSADGQQVIFRVRRPAYIVNSSMFIEDGTGREIGELHQRFHLLKRNYDLYLDKRQFASIEGTFLAWDFELKDEKGGTLAYIDRNFQGFGKEIFTDAGKYVIHFGSRTGKYPVAAPPIQPQQPLSEIDPGVSTSAPTSAATSAATVAPTSAAISATTVAATSAAASLSPSVPAPAAGTSVSAAITTTTVTTTTTSTTTTTAASQAASTTTDAAPAAAAGFGGITPASLFNLSTPKAPEPAPAAVVEERAVARPMDISERLIGLACAIAIDYDYFSQHSHGGGFMPMPIILPGGGDSAAVPDAAPPAGLPGTGALDNTGAGAAAGAANSTVNSGAGMPPPTAGPGETNLGGDGFPAGGDSATGLGYGDQGDTGFKWDDIGNDAGGAAEAAGESGGVIGLAKTLFGVFFGDDSF